jgi:hypothetical protein
MQRNVDPDRRSGPQLDAFLLVGPKAVDDDDELVFSPCKAGETTVTDAPMIGLPARSRTMPVSLPFV